MKPPPIISLILIADQERLFRQIWSPVNTFGGGTDVDVAWCRWCQYGKNDEWAVFPWMMSRGDGILRYTSRKYLRDTTPVNSIAHFVEYLAQMRRTPNP